MSTLTALVSRHGLWPYEECEEPFMTIALFGNTLTDAWLEGTAQLHECDGEALNLVMTIADPDPNHADPAVVDALNRLLCQTGKQTVETVANTIFPSAFLRGRCS